MTEINIDILKKGMSPAADWEIPADATDPADIMESSEAEIAESDTLIDKIKNMFRTNKLALVSAIIIVLFVVIALAASIVSPHDPNAQELASRLQGPSLAHLMGTDHLGRDVFSRMIYGSQISLMIGLIPTAISMVIGTVLGLIAGFVGGKIDSIIMRISDVLMAFPSLLLAILVAYTIGTGLLTIYIALSFVGWAGTARMVRSEVLSLREKEYVEAATSIGVKRSKILLRHILPNCLPTLIVLFTMNVPGNIMTESSLSFLGIGAQPPATSWGLMVFQSKKYLATTPVATLAPGVAILILVLAFNFLGDAIRDAVDPYLKD